MPRCASALTRPLTYAANWTDYRQVPFWDALDVIGIQAYFPLTEDPDYDEEDIRAGWAERMGELRAFGELHNRNILFTELGYNQSHQAPTCAVGVSSGWRGRAPRSGGLHARRA